MSKIFPFSLALAVALGAAVPASAGDIPEPAPPEIAPWGVDLEGRDPSVRPQDDFFRWANGTWIDEFEIPSDLSSYSSFTRLHLESEEQIEEILEEAASANASPASVTGKVATLYSGFLDPEAIEAAGLRPLEPELARTRSVRTHEDVARRLAELERIGGSSPFNFWIDLDPKDPSRYLAQLYQSGLGLPDRDYYLVEDNERFAKARSVYREYLEDLLTLGGHESPGPAAEAIFALETRLAEAHWPNTDLRDVDKTYNPMTPGELAASAPGFPWEVWLGTTGLADQEQLIVMTPGAFTDMAAIFAETPVETWRDWITYRLLRNNAAFLPEEIDRTHFEFWSAAVSGAEEQRPRPKRAVGLVNGAMGEAVGQVYVSRHFPADSKRRMEELVANLRAAFAQRIDDLDWMTPETKAEARDKLAKFRAKIGYPDEWRDYSELEIREGDLLGNVFRARAFGHDREMGKLDREVDRDEWLMDPQVVNAYYNSSLNEIVFPAAILQPPFFDPAADDAVNYGAIGAVIGHEIGHGFDDQGRKSDGDGVLRDWWTEEDARRFQVRADSLVAQYSRFSPLPGMSVNGELTLGENIGDLGGLEIAYSAYRLSLNGKEPPIIDGLTGDQRFFLGFAQIWRGKMRDEIMTFLISSDPHSPEEFRVNGTLPNMDAWYAAFDVKPGDAMYRAPEDRVRIW
jgi:predicted metalloendopeptidase